MTSFQSSELTELPVVENSQLFAQRAHSARYAPSEQKPLLWSRFMRKSGTGSPDLGPCLAQAEVGARSSTGTLGEQTDLMGQHCPPSNHGFRVFSKTWHKPHIT